MKHRFNLNLNNKGEVFSRISIGCLSHNLFFAASFFIISFVLLFCFSFVFVSLSVYIFIFPCIVFGFEYLETTNKAKTNNFPQFIVSFICVLPKAFKNSLLIAFSFGFFYRTWTIGSIIISQSHRNQLQHRHRLLQHMSLD